MDNLRRTLSVFWWTCVLVAVCAGSAAAMPPLHVRLDFSDQAIPAAIRQTAVGESARLWAPYGVDVTSARSTADRGASVTVRVVPDLHTERKSGDLGELRFHADGTPDPEVTIFYRAIAKLATSGEVMGVNPAQYPTRVRDDAIGRALGRVLAHELGHFLLRSPHHPSSGLMRPRFEATLLSDPDDGPFSLTESDRARLEIVRRAVYPESEAVEAGTDEVVGGSQTVALVR